MNKYTLKEIEALMSRVSVNWLAPKLKKGTVAEWTFEYPNGQKTVNIEYAYPMDESNADDAIGKKVVLAKIQNSLWELVGQYTIATGERILPLKKGE